MSETRFSKPGDVSQERVDLTLALLRRDSRVEDGRDALRRSYQSAPEAMIEAATYHLYAHGPGAVIDYLAEAELLIRDPEHQPDYGAAFHLLYHVYNWQQFQQLLPDPKGDMLAYLEDLEQAVGDDDRESVLRCVEDMRSILEASRDLPAVP